MKEYMNTMEAAIRARVSCRTYSSTPMEDEVKENISNCIRSNNTGPFGNAIRFELLDISEMERDEIRKIGTYGVIKNATCYIVGAVEDGPRAMEDYGYCMERIILHSTGLGLGTCWVGGTFRRSGFARRIGVTRSELGPAITPLGYPERRRSFRDSIIRFSAGSKNRKKWSSLFFIKDLSNPISKKSAGKYTQVLESVRLAPSASNRQPWRIVREGKVHHLLLRRTRGYQRVTGRIKLQNLDMGIAMCHFELSARKLGLHGIWKELAPEFDHSGTEYIVSWIETE